MAVATPRWKDRVISKSASGWTGTLGWDVVQFVDELDAYNAIPAEINDSHPDEPALMLARFRPANVGLTMMTIVAEYAVPKDGYFEPNAAPLDQLERYIWKSGGSNLPVDRDIDHNPLITSAKVPATGITDFFKTRFLHITRYEPFYNAALAQEIENTVNAAAMTIAGFGAIDQGTLICRTYQPTQDYTSAALWVHVEYVFEYNANGFQARFIDADRFCLDAQGNTQQILDASGNPVSKDIILNGRGAPVQSGFWAGKIGNAPTAGATPAGAAVQSTASANYLTYNIKGSYDFTSLGL
ncbi:MAG: hypothetical protein M0Z50_04695 [Planctomycetia bacterium]|nr:hypothetical protein [Planctomycetia bacterium]